MDIKTQINFKVKLNFFMGNFKLIEFSEQNVSLAFLAHTAQIEHKIRKVKKSV